MELKIDEVYETASGQLAHIETMTLGNLSGPRVYSGAIAGRGLANWLEDGTSLQHKDFNLVKQTDTLPAAHISVHEDTKEEYA